MNESLQALRGPRLDLAAILAASSCPLTLILEDLSGQQLRIEVLASGERPLTDAEAFRLHAAGGTRCRWRHGLLVTGSGAVAASVSLLWLPPRLPAAACRELDDAAKPAGTVLGRYGMWREDRRAMPTQGIEEVTGADAAVRSTAVLVAGGRPVGIAEEHLTRAFAETLLSRYRGALGLAGAGAATAATAAQASSHAAGPSFYYNG